MLICVICVMVATQYWLSRRVNEMEAEVTRFISSRIEVAPSDVLREVRDLREEMRQRTDDRWRKQDHEKWAEKLQQLNPGLELP